MKRVVFAVGALAALAQPQAVAATAMNGAPIDPRNLIADDLETEALASYARNAARAPFRGQEIVIVDYRLPSSARRLYIVNLMTGAVDAQYVSHGRGSDPGHTKVAMRFGDVPESGMSSLGAYRGGPRYQSPSHGPAMRLHGLDASNRSAYERLIVFHTAPYFDPANGKFGRSLGCFVVTTDQRARIYDVIADGGFLYAGPACLGGGNCRKPAPRDDLIIASAEPAKPAAPVIVAATAPPPVAKAAPAPVALASLATPSVMSDASPRLQLRPRAEPAVVAVAFAAPVPRAKPALDSEEQLAAAREILARRRASAPVLTADAGGVALNAAAPVPLAKPRSIAVALVAAIEPAGEVPVPHAKPVLTDTPVAAAGEADPDAPLPVAKPQGIGAVAAEAVAVATTPGQADLAADEAVPLPLAKPDLFGAPQEADMAEIRVPDTQEGEIPVPAAKPSGLRRVADAGPLR